MAEPATIRVEGQDYTAHDILVQKRALEDAQGYRFRTTWDLVRLAKLYLLPELDVSGEQIHLLADLAGTPALQALFILDSLNRTRSVAGDVCEFGVAQGKTSALLAATLRQHGDSRRLWLYDSFEGLPVPSEKDVMIDDLYQLGDIAKYSGMFSVPEALVRSEVAKTKLPESQVVICKGWITPKQLAANSPDHVSFCYLDMDFYESTRDVLLMLVDKMPPSGVAVIDDYEFFSAGVATAVQEVLADFPGRFEFARPLNDKFAVLTKTS